MKKITLVFVAVLVVLFSTVFILERNNLSSNIPQNNLAQVPSGTLLLYSTLNNASAVSNPTNGTGVGASVATTPANDFVSGQSGNAIRLDSIAEYVRFQQTDGSTKNVELDRGTLDFWFQPNYNHNDGQKYRIFGVGNWGTAGAWGMGKHNASNNNDFYIHKFDASGNLEAINTIKSSNYSWNANDWVNVRVTWDWKVSAGVQNVHVYFNGIEAPLEGDNGKPVTTGTWYTAAESPSAYIYVGNVSSTSGSGMMNNANFDEVKIWDTVIPPTTTPPPTPAPTVSFSASPSSIASGDASTLTWTSNNATSCSASGDWSGSKATSGTESVSPTANASYTITCTGAGGSTNRTASITVTSGTAAPTVTFSASPVTISSGGSSTLTWSSTNATSCTASGGWSGSKAISGTQSVSPTSNTTYTLACTGTGGTTSRNTSVSISTPAGPINPPALPQLLNFNYPQVTGTTWTVNSGGNLQTALNQAQRGDEIVLEAGATFTGNFTLPAKSGTPANGWIVIRSSQSSQLPNRGIRVGPTHASLMPKILTSNTQPALTTTTSGVASGWWITGVEISVTPTYNTAYIQYGLVRLGINAASQNTLAMVPSDIVLDRVYIHGLVDTPTSRCLELNSARTQISDSYLGECHNKGFDSQAISGYNGPGPYKIVNNMLMGVGENIMFGGADPRIPNLIPSDIEIKGNYIYTPASWGATSKPTLWTKKNLFELKNAKRVLLEGNILDGSWSDAQKGMAIVLRSSNQSGSCTWCESSDITIRYNLLRNAPGVFDFLGNSGSDRVGAPVNTILVEHNLFENIGVPPFDQGSKIFAQFTGSPTSPRDVTIRNNTMTSWNNIGQYINFGSSTIPMVTNFEYRDNITPLGNYGIFASGGAQGESIFTGGVIVAGTAAYSGNVVIGTPNLSRYPTTQFVSNIAAARATGKGANEAAVLSATQYAENGGGTPPPPPSSPSVSLSATPASIVTGGSSTLSWSSSNVSSCTASGGWSGSKSTSGTQSVSPTANTTYTLTCTGSNGSTNRSVNITVTSGTAAPTVTISANPTSISSSGSSTLTWSSTNATSCTASGAWSGSRATTGTLSVSPATSSTYTLTCTGAGGSANQSASVTVGSTGTPPSKNFVIGDTVRTTSSLNIRTSATGSVIGVQPVGSVGTVVGGPIYNVNAVGYWWNVDFDSGVDGWGYENFLEKTTPTPPPTPQPTLSITATPSSISSGSSSTLTWSSTNATSCTASGGWSGSKQTSGTQSVSPTSTSSYTISCSGAGGTITQSVTVTVAPPLPQPTVLITASPSSIISGGSSTLTWSAVNATSCTASGGWTGSKAVPSGSQTVAPTTNTTYVINCSGTGGSTSQSVTVTVGAIVVPPTVSISSTPTTIPVGGSANLTWSSTNATSCTASGGWSGSKQTSGTQSVSPNSSNTYTIACTGSGGTANQSVTVTVNQPTTMPIVSLNATPSSVAPGGSSILTWVVQNASSCIASGAWSGKKSTTGNTTITNITTSGAYTLFCTGSGGSASQSVTIRISSSNSGGGGGGGGSTKPPTNTTPTTPGNVVSPINNSLTTYYLALPLTMGVTNSDIAILQTFLRSKGFLPATQVSTGFFGNLTFQAVQGYQRSKGLVPDGKVGPITRAALNADLGGSAPTTNPVVTPSSTTPVSGTLYRTLYRGVSGPDVMYLQGVLKNLGFFQGNTTLYFGPVTEASVQAFQRANNIVSVGQVGYGVVGPATTAKIRALLADN